jgi:hypothetical protein
MTRLDQETINNPKTNKRKADLDPETKIAKPVHASNRRFPPLFRVLLDDKIYTKNAKENALKLFGFPNTDDTPTCKPR